MNSSIGNDREYSSEMFEVNDFLGNLFLIRRQI